MRGPESFIFQTVVRFTFFLINVLAVYLMLRGHNLPGGGFIAGLASAIALILLSLATGAEEFHRMLRFDPVRLASWGLAIAFTSCAAPLLFGKPFLEHFHWHLHHVPLLGDVHVGTPLFFDFGVFLVVIGVACKIIFALARSTQGRPALRADELARYCSVREQPVEDQPVAEDGADDLFPGKEGSRAP